MDNKTNNDNNNNVNNTTSSDIEIKIRREKINNGKQEQSNVKTPRRYNPMNNSFNENEKIDYNKPLDNKQGLTKENDNSIEDENQNQIQPEQNNELVEQDNDVNNNNSNQPLSDGSNNNQNDLNNNNNVQNPTSTIHNNNVQNSVTQRKNNVDNNQNNLTKDPTQRKLDRINNQKKQQDGAKNENNTDAPSNNNVNNPNQNTPKTKGSAPEANKPSDDSASKLGNSLNKLNQMKNNIGSALEGAANKDQAIKNVAKEKVKEQVKKKVRTKIIAFITNVILPVLPYIGIILLIIFLILLLIFGIFGYLDDEDNVVGSIKINYCEYVNLKWGEDVEQNVTVSANDYIKYKINTSEFRKITDQKALMALVVVYRTNLYANSNNLDGNTCYFEVNKEYVALENEILDAAIEESDNKVFSVSKTVLAEIKIDEKFTYSKVQEEKYTLYQDKWSYNKNWVDKFIGNNNISNNTNSLATNSFSPFGAWYLAENNGFDALSLIFHFVTPGSYKGNIYKVEKLSSGGYVDGEYNASCSDISLSTTSLDRKEFIDKVNSYNTGYSAFSTFKTNAGKIYDISVKNNFNPEMVVIRAIVEGFSPGGSTYNFWGIGCANGKKCSVSFNTFDQGVLGYIETVKKINSVSLFEMQRKYAYIGSNWFNPGGPGVGGCYYFPYVKKYLSETRANEVAEACASGATCTGASCLKTTDEDQNAYTRFQIEKMLQLRVDVFGVSVDECSEQEGATEDVPASELGKAVAQYAVKTYDNWKYSQDNRHQNGYVDCSSLVSRAYLHFNVKIFDSSDTSGEIYRWCEKNKKNISGESLAAGDLIFYNTGSHVNSDNYKGIGHVEMYIGNNQKFGAHSAYTGTGNNRRPRAAADQVSVTTYNGNGNLFCRPASA